MPTTTSRRSLKKPLTSDGSTGLRTAISDNADICDALPLRTYSASKPSSPADGDMWVYPADTTAGVLWEFTYVSARARWEFTGGNPLWSAVDTTETTTRDGTYRDPATVGPSLTVPFAGDYWIDFGAISLNDYNASGWISPSGAGLTASDTIGIGPWIIYAYLVSNDVAIQSGPRVYRKTLTTGTLKLLYKNAYVKNRWLRLTPAFIDG